MTDVPINYLAVLVAAIASMVIGALWYSPVLFAKAWMTEVGKKLEDLKDKAMTGYIWTSIAKLVGSYVLAHFVFYTHATTVATGAATGAWIGFGFVAMALIDTHVFEGKSWKLWWINAGYQFVNLVVMGMILAVWH